MLSNFFLLAMGPLLLLPILSLLQTRAPITLPLTLDQSGLNFEVLEKSELGYIPSGMDLVEERPAAIGKEPSYLGKPLYGALRIGNGPKSVTFFAIDEPASGRGRILMDLNQNGDLTDDGSEAWDEAIDREGIVNYAKKVTLHASWGSPVKEEEGGAYTLFLYKPHGDPRIFFTKLAARKGQLTLGGRTYPVMIGENGNDGLFMVVKRSDRTRRPVQLYIDLDGDGTFKGIVQAKGDRKIMAPETFSLDQPIQIGGEWWDTRPSLSGSELLLTPTNAPGAPALPIRTDARPLLASGTPAPDFEVLTPQGKPLRLSHFRGKVVILDFWATWCSPCLASMPGLEKIYAKVKSQGVEVLSVNVFDARAPFDAWIGKNAGTNYSFTFAYDSAGRDEKKSIAAARYNVTGIPAMYVIDRTGKVKTALEGSGHEPQLIQSLKSLGIKVE